LLRPADKRADPAGILPSKLIVRLFTSARRVLRIAALNTQGNTMTIGTVKFFNTSKGFGFIAPDDGGKDVFVHATAVEAAGMRSLNEGQKVSFDIQPDARGSKATNLKAV